MGIESEIEVQCPYCGEPIQILVDISAGPQEYIEDCQVCCRPMNLVITLDAEGQPRIEARRDDE